MRGYNLCFAIELTQDYSTPQGGREKLLPIREGDDWGFPCCATKDRPYDDRARSRTAPAWRRRSTRSSSATRRSTSTTSSASWPDPWGHRAYVPLHGAYGSWDGARLVGIELDRMTGMVLPGSDLTRHVERAPWPTSPPAGTGTRRSRQHGRPTVVAFAPDGRLFLGNDTNGDIIWIAPLGLVPAVGTRAPCPLEARRR